ncbi:hypothetical protein Tco_0482237 [Tanacetum coccineum]
MEQYLALSRENQAPGVVKPGIGGNVNFEIKSQFMRELKEDTFSDNKNEDAHDHVDRVLNIGPIPRMTLTQAPTATQTMVDHSQKWHNGTSSRNISNNKNSDGLAAIVRPHLNKECPLNEEVNPVEEVKYDDFGRPAPFNRSNEAKFRVGPPRWPSDPSVTHFFYFGILVDYHSLEVHDSAYLLQILNELCTLGLPNHAPRDFKKNLLGKIVEKRVPNIDKDEKTRADSTILVDPDQQILEELLDNQDSWMEPHETDSRFRLRDSNDFLQMYMFGVVRKGHSRTSSKAVTYINDGARRELLVIENPHGIEVGPRSPKALTPVESKEKDIAEWRLNKKESLPFPHSKQNINAPWAKWIAYRQDSLKKLEKIIPTHYLDLGLKTTILKRKQKLPTNSNPTEWLRGIRKTLEQRDKGAELCQRPCQCRTSEMLGSQCSGPLMKIEMEKIYWSISNQPDHGSMYQSYEQANRWAFKAGYWSQRFDAGPVHPIVTILLLPDFGGVIIGIGFVLDFVEFISFTFGDKEMISVIEAVSR